MATSIQDKPADATPIEVATDECMICNRDGPRVVSYRLESARGRKKDIGNMLWNLFQIWIVSGVICRNCCNHLKTVHKNHQSLKTKLIQNISRKRQLPTSCFQASQDSTLKFQRETRNVSPKPKKSSYMRRKQKSCDETKMAHFTAEMNEENEDSTADNEQSNEKSQQFARCEVKLEPVMFKTETCSDDDDIAESSPPNTTLQKVPGKSRLYQSYTAQFKERPDLELDVPKIEPFSESDDYSVSSTTDETSLQKHVANIHSEEKLLEINHLENELVEDECSKLEEVETNSAKYVSADNIFVTCENCLKSFETKQQLAEHEKECSCQAELFECEVCFESFMSKQELQVHEAQQCFENVIYKCSNCNERFSTSAELALHERKFCKKEECSNQNLICDICGEKSESQRAFRQHKRVHTVVKDPPKNDDLSLSENSLTSFSESENQEEQGGSDMKYDSQLNPKTSGGKLVCEVCNKVLTSQAKLKNHMRLHTGCTPYKCTQCDPVEHFASVSDFTKHMRTHNKEYPFTCEICSRQYKLFQPYDAHFAIWHPNDNLFECDKCHGKYVTPRRLFNHLLALHSKKYVCDVCGKECQNVTDFRHHTNIHSDKKPYQCSKCDKAYFSSRSLKVHMMRHNKDNLWICEHCGQSFSDHSKLHRHSLIHKGIRPYQCTMCDKSFNQSYNLKIHLRGHTGENPYKCDLCEQTFRYNLLLKQHKKTHKSEDS